MSRSNYKKAYFAPAIWKKIFKKKLNKAIWGRLIFTRSSATPTTLSNAKYFVYNGKIFNKLNITHQMSFKKLGEYSVTKKPFFFPKKDKKKR